MKARGICFGWCLRRAEDRGKAGANAKKSLLSLVLP